MSHVRLFIWHLVKASGLDTTAKRLAGLAVQKNLRAALRDYGLRRP